MKKNISIKVKMVEEDITQVQLAEESDIARSILNQIISGRVNPTEAEKERIATALGAEKGELFS